MKIIMLLISVLTLSACAPKVWMKPGSTRDEFSKDKYECMQNSQQRVSGAYVDAYGGVANNKVITNAGLFKSCMNSRGWYLGNREDRQASPAKQQAIQHISTAKDKLDEIMQESKDTCLNPEYKIFFEKSPCNIQTATLAHLSNNEKIQAAEKVVFLKYYDEVKQRSIRRIEAYKSGKTPKSLELAKLNEQTSETFEANSLELYEGKISWGEFNKNRKKIASTYQEEFNRIVNQKGKF